MTECPPPKEEGNPCAICGLRRRTHHKWYRCDNIVGQDGREVSKKVFFCITCDPLCSDCDRKIDSEWINYEVDTDTWTHVGCPESESDSDSDSHE